MRARIDAALRRLDRRRRVSQKETAELRHWSNELVKLRAWFVEGTTDWWGLPAPSADQKLRSSDLWSTNAILTMHRLRPGYWEELQAEATTFAGERVLEVGCGPAAPILQFDECERHGIDPLVDSYLTAGWPLYDLRVTFVNSGAENMPYPDGWFDSVISVNALDHVDDFPAVASEIERVLKPGGRLMFEVEYHEPTVTEPLKLDDRTVQNAFSRISLDKIRELDGSELSASLADRFDLLSEVIPPLGSGGRWALWTGVRGDKQAAT